MVKNSNLQLYKEFMNPQDAEDFINLLSINNLSYVLFTNGIQVDKSIFETDIITPILVATEKKEVSRLRKIIEQELKGVNVDELKNHLLYDLQEEELITVIIKEDENPYEDVIIARKILADRGAGLTEQEIDDRILNQKKKIQEEVREGKSSFFVVDCFFVLACILIVSYSRNNALLILFGFGFIAVVMLYYILKRKKDTEEISYFAYNKLTRGASIFTLIWLLFWVIKLDLFSRI